MLPALASASAWRSEPGPESAVLVTVIVAAEADAAASSMPAPATRSSVAALPQTRGALPAVTYRVAPHRLAAQDYLQRRRAVGRRSQALVAKSA